MLLQVPSENALLMTLRHLISRRKRPCRSSRKNYLLFDTLVFGLVFFASPFLGLSDNDPSVVKRVVDGDTLILGNNEWVRLIGVDTPETKHPNKPVERFGKEASAFTKRMA